VRATVIAYWLLNVAAMIRVLTPLLLTGEFYHPGIAASGALWSLSFLIFTIVYLPILIRPRADGRPG
jgi:uncharacterized protein involved in response to NO